MLEFLFKSKTQPIGLDIGHSMIKMIQLCQLDQTICVEAVEEEKIDRSLEFDSDQWREHVVELIREMYQRGGFKGQQVISCLPSNMLKIKSLRLDGDYAEEIEQIKRTEVAKRFSMNPDHDEIRYMVAGDAYQGSEMKKEVIFLGAAQESLKRHIELIEESGLIPISLDAVPTALFRCFIPTLRRREDQEMISVFVDLGSQFTTVIIGRGHEISFVKQIPIGADALNEQVSLRLEISLTEAAELRERLRTFRVEHVDAETRRAVIDAMSDTIEDLAHELSLCFRYYAVTFRGQRPTEAAFVGGQAHEPVLIDTFRRHLGMKVRVAEPLSNFDCTRVDLSRRFNPKMCEWAIAVGLALKGFESEKTEQGPSQHLQETAV